MQTFEGKVAVVTGAASGIGKGLAGIVGSANLARHIELYKPKSLPL